MRSFPVLLHLITRSHEDREMTNLQTITAATRAAERNLATIARAEERGLTFYGVLPESAAHWAESHKERRGFRARGYDWREKTAAEWTAMSDDLLAAEAAW